MTNEFTAIIEQDAAWFIAYSPQIPGANGQGKTKDEARETLAEAVKPTLICKIAAAGLINRKTRVLGSVVGCLKGARNVKVQGLPRPKVP